MSAAFENSDNFDIQTSPVRARQRIEDIDEAVSRHLSQLYWDWRALFDLDPLANPLQHPDYALIELVAECVHSPFKPVLIFDEDPVAGKAIAVLIPKTVNSHQVGGLGPRWTFQGMRLAGGRFLAAKASTEQQARLLQEATRYCAMIGARFLLIEDLDENHALSDAVYDQQSQGCYLFTVRDFQPRQYVDLPAKEADYWKKFTSASLRKQRAKLRKAGRHRLDRITDIGQIPDFLSAAHEISKQSWQSHQFGMRICDNEMELRLFSSLAQQGLLRCYVWWVEDQPAAFAVCTQNRGSLRYEETAFSNQFRHISAGVSMLHLIVEDLYRHDTPRFIDFGGGDAEYKQHFANRQSRSGTVWVVPATWTASWSLSYLNACRCISKGFRSLVKGAGWGTKARQWIRSCQGQPVNDNQEQEAVPSAVEPS